MRHGLTPKRSREDFQERLSDLSKIRCLQPRRPPSVQLGWLAVFVLSGGKGVENDDRQIARRWCSYHSAPLGSARLSVAVAHEEDQNRRAIHSQTRCPFTESKFADRQVPASEPYISGSEKQQVVWLQQRAAWHIENGSWRAQALSRSKLDSSGNSRQPKFVVDVVSFGCRELCRVTLILGEKVPMSNDDIRLSHATGLLMTMQSGRIIQRAAAAQFSAEDGDPPLVSMPRQVLIGGMVSVPT